MPQTSAPGYTTWNFNSSFRGMHHLNSQHPVQQNCFKLSITLETKPCRANHPERCLRSHKASASNEGPCPHGMSWNGARSQVNDLAVRNWNAQNRGPKHTSRLTWGGCKRWTLRAKLKRQIRSTRNCNQMPITRDQALRNRTQRLASCTNGCGKACNGQYLLHPNSSSTTAIWCRGGSKYDSQIAHRVPHAWRCHRPM